MNFINRLKYRCCCCSSSSSSPSSYWLVVIQKFTWISRTNSKFKLKLEKGFFFSLLRLVLAFFFAGINCAGSLALHLLCTCICVCVCLRYICLFVFVFYIEKQENKTRHNVSFSACVLMAFGLFMLPRIPHTEIAILSNVFAAGFQICTPCVCVCVFSLFFNPQTDAG